MTTPNPRAHSVAVGDRAPDFRLPAADGTMVSLSDQLAQHVVVLYFYPKDNTKGCTTQACAFRDQYDDFRQAGAAVIGVSGDSAAQHDHFAGQYQLPFLLLSDADGAVRRDYGARAAFGLLPGRVTYVIDQTGIVRYHFSSMTQVQHHVREALKVVQALQPADSGQ